MNGFYKLSQAREEEDTKERKRPSYKVPLTALGLTAAGYGMKRLGDAALTPTDRATVDDLIALKSRIGEHITPGPGAGLAERMLPAVKANPDIEGSRALFYDYIDRASKATKVKPYGQPIVPTIHKLKGVLGLEGPATPDALLSPLDRENLQHYPAFEAGPVPAYLHQVRKVLLDRNWDNWVFKPGGKGESVFKDGPQAFQPKFEAAFNEYVNQQSPGGTNTLNHGKQMDVVRGFSGWLDAKHPELGQANKVMEGNLADAQRWASNAYASGAEKAVTVAQDWPRRIGTGLMVAGGGLAAYWLIRKALAARKRKKEQDAVEKTTLSLN